jgi:peptidoglycan/LPS O-acetylase OafA/YrhL
MTHHDTSAQDDRLQSLRGLAALTVALGHAATVPLAGRIEAPDFHLRGSNALLAAAELLFQANTAVILFYVLSGFVLAGSLRRRPLPIASQTAGFVIRRVGRIVPIMWLSIAFAVAVLAFGKQRSFPGATPWFNMILATPTSLHDVMLNLAGIHTEINGPLWSVQIELEIAPFLPLLVLIADRLDARLIAPMYAALGVASPLLWYVAPNAVLYAYSFYLGIALPRILASRGIAAVARRPTTLVLCLIVLLPTEWAYCTGRLWLPYKFTLDAIVSAEIIGFVILRPAGALSAQLRRRPLVVLGNLSYSFYAFHLSVLVLLATALLSVLPTDAFENDLIATVTDVVLAIGSVALALAMAALSYVLVERRGTEWGRRYGARLEQWRPWRFAVSS